VFHTDGKIESATLKEREPLLSVGDVATRLGMSEQFVRDHVSRHQPIIPSIQMGSTIKFPRY
jgi:hypothetical protein